MTKSLFNGRDRIPTTRKGMRQLAMSILKDIDNMLIYEFIPPSKFKLAERLFGHLTARHQYIGRLHYVDDAEAVILSQDIGRGPAAQPDVDRYSYSTLINEGSRLAAKAYRAACIGIGVRIWEALMGMNEVKTGDVLVGKYGTLEHRLVLTQIYMVKDKPSQIVARYGGKKRIFRLGLRDTGQMTWLEDHNMACFSSNGLNFCATATVY